MKLLKQFDKWDYNVWYKSVNKRMPWLGAKKGLLTTSGTSDYYWFGTIISETDEYAPAPWISSEMTNPAVIWYWVNEDDCDADRHPSMACIILHFKILQSIIGIRMVRMHGRIGSY